MSELQMQDNLYWLLLRVSFRAKHGLLKLAEEYDLTVMQIFTLCLLEPGKAVPMNSISGLLMCDASNVTGIVDRLVAATYIERKEHTEDRRVKTIKLSEKGLHVRNELFQRTATQLPGAANLSQEEIKTLKKLLAKTLVGCIGAK